jgi:hypothetical protein
VVQWKWWLAGLAAVALALAALTAAGAQSDDVTIAIVGPESVEEAGDEEAPEPARFDVVVRNTTELGAFQFILAFDPDYFDYDSAERGDFLGSTGRDVQCDEPQTDVGAVRIVCVTLGELPEGATGEGTLYTVLLRPKATGDTQLSLARVQLSDPPGEEIQTTTEPFAVQVESPSSGIDWMIWGPVIGGVVLLILLLVAVMVMLTRRGRDASASAPDYGN